MKIQFLGISGLAISKSSELFRISEDEFNLEASFVSSIDLDWLKLQVS